MDSLVLWAGQMATDIREGDLQRMLTGVKVYLVIGRKDEFINEATIAAHENWLTTRGIDYELIWFDGPHIIHEPTLLQLSERLKGDST